MKKILLTAALFAAITGTAQELKPYKVSDKLTIDMPENTISEKLTDPVQTIYRGEIDGAVLMIEQLPDENGSDKVLIGDEATLKHYYKGFCIGIMSGFEGKLVSEKAVKRNGLLWEDLVFRTEDEGDKQLWHCHAILLDKQIYAIFFAQSEGDEALLEPEREKFYASVQIPAGTTMSQQFNATPAEIAAENAGEMNALTNHSGNSSKRSSTRLMVKGAILVIVLIVAGITAIIRRRKKQNDGFL